MATSTIKLLFAYKKVALGAFFAPGILSENRQRGASIRKRHSLLTYPLAWEAKPTEGYIAKEAPFLAFLNLERV